jgi:ketosteroid isomerase-like protein
MSQENVEIVRSVYDAAARGDSERVFALYDPEVVLDSSRLEVVTTLEVYRGHDGLRTFFRDWNEAWESIDYDVEELIDAGGQQVVSVVTRHGRGRTSGAEVDLHVALAWTVRDGKVVRVAWFRTRADALEAVGLAE